jgi:hypothetical protein
MQVTDVFSISSSNESTGLCTLTLHGVVLAKQFRGAKVAAQFACSNTRYLVCLNFGDIWDDALSIYLLSPHGNELDSITGGGAMSAGTYLERSYGSEFLEFTFLMTKLSIE